MPFAIRHVRERSRLPGLLIGAGLGGFVDGIVLHQIAQWHNMGSAMLPPVTMAAMSRNMRWDGLFHAATWCLVLAGVLLLARDAHAGRLVPRTRMLVGQLVLGWAAFNLIEGVIDHHLLDLHHVRDMPAHVPLYDWLFLLVGGVGLGALGWWLARGDRRDRNAS
ncbi:MAG: DUF2243 domain-containing protein [Gemmatimonadaceae bacterium]|jgi:uncharacterized membrane protein|nr:DUF2243 domain-containing protein [Gemmatimonadaceae bacterium]